MCLRTPSPRASVSTVSCPRANPRQSGSTLRKAWPWNLHFPCSSATGSVLLFGTHGSRILPVQEAPLKQSETKTKQARSLTARLWSITRLIYSPGECPLCKPHSIHSTKSQTWGERKRQRERFLKHAGCLGVKWGTWVPPWNSSLRLLPHGAQVSHPPYLMLTQKQQHGLTGGNEQGHTS